jgi:uncharacterized protein YchJ
VSAFGVAGPVAAVDGGCPCGSGLGYSQCCRPLHDSVGEVEFEAAHADGVLHERSRFVKRAGRWVYVDGDVG